MACGSRTPARYFDTRQSTAGFLRAKLVGGPGAAPLPADVPDPVPGNQTCAANNQRAYDPANPGVLLSSAFIGNLVPGSGSQINGMIADGYPGMRPGEYFKFTPFVAAPRVGFAWDINGNGKQALRASTGIVLRDTDTRGMGRVRRHAAGGVQPPRSGSRRSPTSRTSPSSGKTFVETPITVAVRRRRNTLAREVLQPERGLPA